MEKNYWVQRYIKNETGWDLGTASAPIITYINQVEDKSLKILMPGAGNGYEAEYIFKQGFKNVYVLDWAKQALLNLALRCPDFPKQNMIHMDFFDHKEPYDLIIEQTFFCALKPSLRKNYVDKMFTLLKEKGKLVGLLFHIIFEREGPPFGGSKKEYIQLFESKFNLKTIDHCYNSMEPRAGTELFINFIKK